MMSPSRTTRRRYSAPAVPISAMGSVSLETMIASRRLYRFSNSRSRSLYSWVVYTVARTIPRRLASASIRHTFDLESPSCWAMTFWGTSFHIV